MLTNRENTPGGTREEPVGASHTPHGTLGPHGSPTDPQGISEYLTMQSRMSLEIDTEYQQNMSSLSSTRQRITGIRPTVDYGGEHGLLRSLRLEQMRLNSHQKMRGQYAHYTKQCDSTVAASVLPVHLTFQTETTTPFSSQEE